MKIFKKYLIIFLILFFQGCEDKIQNSFNELVINIDNLPIPSDLSRSALKLDNADVYLNGSFKGSFDLSSSTTIILTVSEGSHDIRIDLTAPNYLNIKTIMFSATKNISVGSSGAYLPFLVSDFSPYEQNFYFYEDFESTISSKIYTTSFTKSASRAIDSRSFYASFSSSTNYTSFKIDDLQLPSTGFYTLVFHYSSIGSDCSLDVFIDKYDDSNTSYYSKRVALPSNTSSIIRQELEFSTNAIPNGKFDIYFGGFSSSGTNCSCYIDNIQVY